jgi:hypothetical protein
MPHVDDGTLHALLDGALRAEDPARADVVEAHLESCPDCQALRDRAAALRARATGILAALEPDARPDFQEVLIRAGHTAAPASGAASGAAGGAAGQAAAAGATVAAGGIRGTPRAPGARGAPSARDARIRQARATRAVAWAATVVLALGTGYLIRDLVEPDAMPTTSRTAASPEWSATERSAPESSAPESSAAESSAPESSAPGSSAADRDLVARGSDRPTVEGPATGDRQYAAGSAEPGTPATPPALESAVDAITVAPTALAGEPVTAMTAPRPAMQEVATVTARQRAEDAADRPTIRLRGGSPTTGAGFMAIDELPDGEGWSPITLAEAAALMEGPVYVVPGAVVAGIFARGQGADAEVRSVQRLDGAVAMTVTQRLEGRPEGAVMAEAAAPTAPPAPAAPPAPPEPVPTRAAREAAMDRVADAPEQNEATARHDRHRITVAGPLPAATLQALAASAAPVPLP